MRGGPELRPVPVIRPPHDFCLSSLYRWGAYWHTLQYIYIYNNTLIIIIIIDLKINKQITKTLVEERTISMPSLENLYTTYTLR